MLKGPPVAVSFTRVGGTTRVETALEASRFWRQPPRLIVEVGPGATKAQMLDAARCAMVKDAPLLFMSRDAKRNRLEATTIGAWQAVAPGSAKRQRIRGCVPHGQSDIGGVSTLAVPRRLLRLHRIGISGTLNPVVVFAAIWAPKDPADVAVGMALAAHLERANRETVSLVVVPRYLEDDPGLEHQLRSQRETVKDGIVLGSTSVLPEDTRTLLRQLLRPADPQGVLAQIQSNLEAAGALIAALLGLVTFGAVAPALILLIREFIGIPRSTTPQIIKTETNEKEGCPVAKPSDWLTDLSRERRAPKRRTSRQ